MEAKDVFTLYRIGFVCDMHVVSGHVSTLENLRCAASLGYRNRAEIIVLMCEHKPGYRVNLQSQSKLLGHCTVFLPSQCWSNRFANFTAINNIERERETSEKGKTAFSGSCRRL